MIVVPKSQLKHFTEAGREFAKSAGGNAKDLLLTPEDYEQLQQHRKRQVDEHVGRHRVIIKTCGLSKRFDAIALQMFHADALENGTAGNNPIIVRRATWNEAQQHRM